MTPFKPFSFPVVNKNLRQDTSDISSGVNVTNDEKQISRNWQRIARNGICEYRLLR